MVEHIHPVYYNRSRRHHSFIPSYCFAHAEHELQDADTERDAIFEAGGITQRLGRMGVPSVPWCKVATSLLLLDRGWSAVKPN